VYSGRNAAQRNKYKRDKVHNRWRVEEKKYGRKIRTKKDRKERNKK
jgi:hypothetical protein